ncbi:MAG: tetratricopeptide repeat protein [Acidobacteria bacterium]|nr:tetratricopeptide repeat protein [Acidobacteriota bacterium]
MTRHSSIRLIVIAIVAACVVLPGSAGSGSEECTTLVAAGLATPSGGPILWKNRDTGTLSNKVILVTEHPYSFLALVDADDTAGRAAWAGINAVGFAIANSASYNLPTPAGELQEQEGVVMAEALRTCRTVGDLEQMIVRRQGKRLGVRTNFFAIDAAGGAVIIETHNHGYTRYDASAFPMLRLPNTNFSRSGAENDGSGYLRFDRENQILRTVPDGRLDAETIFRDFARDLSHPLLRHPSREEWKRLPADTPYWIHSNYTIDRPSTASVVVIQGVKPGQDPMRSTMWVALGEPVTTVAVPLWVAAGVPPDEVWQGKDAPISIEASRLKGVLRPLKARERAEYMDLTRLDNAAGTGWLPGLLALEHGIIAETETLLGKNPSPAELAAHQKSMAGRAYATLKGIAPPSRTGSSQDSVPASLAAPALAEAVALQQQKKHQEALTALAKAVAIDPANADASLLSCRSLAALRRHEEAIAACTESLRLRPDQEEVLRDRGHYYLNLGQTEPGLADLVRAVALSPRDRGVYYHLGLAYYLQGDFANAAKAYDGCVLNSGDDTSRVECQTWLLPSLLRSGRKVDAQRLLASVSAAPMDGHPGNYLDRLLLFKGARTEAEVAAAMTAEGPLSEASVGYTIGIWHLLNGRASRAREYFTRAVASNYPTAWGYRAAAAELKRLDGGAAQK